MSKNEISLNVCEADEIIKAIEELVNFASLNSVAGYGQSEIDCAISVSRKLHSKMNVLREYSCIDKRAAKSKKITR